MSRELKFRVWDETKKRYETSDDYKIDLSGRLYFDYYLDGTEKQDEGRFMIEQFTGLHDKNGKEIYEGDIVLAGHITMRDGKEVDEPTYEIVKYHHGIFEPVAYMKNEHIHVVGNIHENKELSKKEK